MEIQIEAEELVQQIDLLLLTQIAPSCSIVVDFFENGKLSNLKNQIEDDIQLMPTWERAEHDNAPFVIEANSLQKHSIEQLTCKEQEAFKITHSIFSFTDQLKAHSKLECLKMIPEFHEETLEFMFVRDNPFLFQEMATQLREVIK